MAAALCFDKVRIFELLLMTPIHLKSFVSAQQ